MKCFWFAAVLLLGAAAASVAALECQVHVAVGGSTDPTLCGSSAQKCGSLRAAINVAQVRINYNLKIIKI